jgi:cytochrome c553
MYEFCYACHDASGQGAETNVQSGTYQGSLYGSNGGILNGGGFESLGETATTSTHLMDGTAWGAYGGGYFQSGTTFAANGSNAGQGPQPPNFMKGTGNAIKMDCASCHDPHGSANYRILKLSVNGNAVGKYGPTLGPDGADDPDPDGFVSSVETGWPVRGFRLHKQYPAYKPNYTSPMYAKGYNMTVATTSNADAGINDAKGMSGWCSGCHSTYLGKLSGSPASFASTYNAGDGSGLAVRHRHPINVPLDNYNGPDKGSMVVTDTTLPLAHAIDEQGTTSNKKEDWIECLTCHRAHGTAAAMTGWAGNTGGASAASIVDSTGVPTNLFPASNPVPSALLRYDNRGVCERCHNK